VNKYGQEHFAGNILQYANCFQTQTTRNGMAQLTFVGAERHATATQQSCTKVFVFRRDTDMHSAY